MRMEVNILCAFDIHFTFAHGMNMNTCHIFTITEHEYSLHNNTQHEYSLYDYTPT